MYSFKKGLIPFAVLITDRIALCQCVSIVLTEIYLHSSLDDILTKLRFCVQQSPRSTQSLEDVRIDRWIDTRIDLDEDA